jgi:chromosome partition protein MukB
MSRTRAEALVLVNWKGVFYERYLLDRHVTALEGANGAGKTTVMIAAYVVLLPDMSRLRFTNLGETGATGGDKGIWGRLGEPGRPSYAVMDFALAGGRRIVAGVHLERKGEPSVEPTPFIVSGLGDDVRLQELMLVAQGDSELVPELPELRENAARLGGRLQVFPSAREYFATLFEQGVTPLRLGTDEERNKLNEMLRTSMTGGISRALTSELRDFLLREESGLAETLQRMRANLEACRRTRTEVQESRRLEQEIGGVFEAGQKMFTAAFRATRERADELERRVAEAEEARAAATEALRVADAAFDLIVMELESSEARRLEAERLLIIAKEWHTRLRDALAAAVDIAQCRRELEAAEKAEQEAAGKRARADEARERRRAELRRAQENHKRAAVGLANVQRGIEELHRRAAAYHQVMRRLHEAEAQLGGYSIPTDELDPRLAECRAQLARVDRERRDANVLLADANDHRQRHGEVLEALRTLVSRDVVADEAHAVATEALGRHREQRALAERAQAIARACDEARQLAARQARVRAQAEKLGVAVGNAPASVVVGTLLDESEAERARLGEEERTARADLASIEQVLKDAEEQRRELTSREPEWRELDARARRLGEYVGAALVDRSSLDRTRSVIGDELAAARKSEEALREAHERLMHEARELLAAGGPFEPDLLRLKDQLGADLVAASFEDVGLDEAGVIEARLGPLAQALVVDDPHAAAQAASGRAEALSQVWFVTRDANLEQMASDAGNIATEAHDVLVQESVALRVSRIPARPRLGRRAREQRAAELRAGAEARARELDDVHAKRRLLERLVEDGEALLAGHIVWLAGDPAPELGELRRTITQGEAQVERLGNEVARLAEAARALGPRIASLRALLGESFLLDPPDYARRTAELDAEHRAALAAQAEVVRTRRAAALVEDQLASLRSPPLGDEALAELRCRVEALRNERDRLEAAADAIEFVLKNTDALGWSDAPARLAGNQALVPALEAQLGEAEDAMNGAEALAGEAEELYDKATADWQDADGRRRAASQQLTAVDARFQAMGIPEPTEDAVRAAEMEVDRLDVEMRALATRVSELGIERGRREATCTQAAKQQKEAEDKVASERREAEPAIARWERLRGLAMQHDLLASVLASGESDVSGIRGHVNLVQEAQKQRAVLIERLRSAQGGAALLTELEVLRDPADTAFADAYLELWLSVRNWLRRRLPAQVAEVDDPREALLRLRDQLSRLDDRLARQEKDLRGASEDVARGIDVQIRKARGQVDRLRKNLDGISFGSIQGIRVRLHPVDKMEQVLRALREGAAQGLLFQEDLPFEEALAEIFRRHGGGRTGGQRLLDYREYVHLQVDIRRKAGADWELANPTRLSTGEAIGVGAALMMVVLTEWERDATLLRGKKSHGSLRFLFLDEANRLSHDNLGVLFDLCQTLDLQLLIAAPEVARAEGNTTYRLVRRTTADGREEVLVSGRRTRADA